MFKTTIKKIKRFLHRHQWVYIGEDVLDESLFLYDYTQARYCFKCGCYNHKYVHSYNVEPSWMNNGLVFITHMGSKQIYTTIFPGTTVAITFRGGLSDYFMNVREPTKNEIRMFMLQHNVPEEHMNIIVDWMRRNCG